MKILLIVSDSDTSWYLINKLSKSYDNLVIAIEKKFSIYFFLKKRLKNNGLFRVLGQIAFKLFSVILILFYKKKINVLKDKYQLLDNKNVNIIRKFFSSINSNDCIKWLKEEKPDIVIINGTRIVSKETINCCNAFFLNIHCGITPEYRGIHGAYWANVNKDLENIGVTVHLVDKGIDTGQILYQKTIDVDESDNIFTYPIKQYNLGIALVIKAIEDISNDKVEFIQKNNLKSRLWEHPTILEYIKNWYFLGIN